MSRRSFIKQLRIVAGGGVDHYQEIYDNVKVMYRYK